MRPIHRYSGSQWRGLKVGLLGGSFNPAHEGHREISLYALKRLKLDAVWWLVSPQNPLKPVSGMAPLEERLNSATQVANHPRIMPVSIETELGTRYTVETLSKLKALFPQTRFVWLMGADNLIQFPKWRSWQRIFQLVPIAVFRRPTYSLSAYSGKAAVRFGRCRVATHQAGRLPDMKPPAWVAFQNRWNATSATAIRSARQKTDRS